MESKKPVLTAFTANLLVALMKVTLAIFSGSTVLFAEAAHSISDTVNQLFLLQGIRLSRQPPSQRYPFGRGKEQFLWSFIAAVSVFGISSLLSIWEGIQKLILPSYPRHLESSLVFLVAIGIIELYALRITYTNIVKRASRRKVSGLRHFFSIERDPIILATFLEDIVAVAGILVAAASIYLSYALKLVTFDSAGSIVIGLMLLAYGAVLATQSKSLLVGEGLPQDYIDRIKTLVQAMPEVIKVLDVRGVYFGSNSIVLGLDVYFIPGLDTVRLQSAIDKIEKTLKSEIKEIAYIYVEAENPQVEPPESE